MTVADLMDTMASTEFTEWHAYYELVAYEEKRARRLAAMGMTAD